MNWDSQSPRRFEYQSMNKVNDHRFELIKLPEISTKHKKSLAFEYDRKRAIDGPAGIDSHLSKEPNRSYKVKYDLVQSKSKYVSFTQKLHKDVMKCSVESEEKKDKLWDRLMKRAEDEKAAEQEAFRKACKDVGLT